MNYDTHYAPIARGQKDLSSMEQNQSSTPLPFGTIAGPTADTVNSAPTAPQSRAEFLARGGMGNTAMQAVNTAEQFKRRKEYESAYMNLLEQGEKGADSLYEEAVGTYGEGIKEWVPPKSFFYDEKTGAFMPHKYAQSVYVGLQKFKEDQKKKQTTLDDQAKKQQEYSTVGEVFKDAKTSRDAITGMGAAGVNPKEYSTILGHLPSEGDQGKNDLQKQRIEAQREKTRTQAMNLELQALRLGVSTEKMTDDMRDRYRKVKRDAMESINKLNSEIAALLNEGREASSVDLTGRPVVVRTKDQAALDLAESKAAQVKEYQTLLQEVENSLRKTDPVRGPKEVDVPVRSTPGAYTIPGMPQPQKPASSPSSKGTGF